MLLRRVLFLLLLGPALLAATASGQTAIWNKAAGNAAQANDAFARCRRVVEAWYARAGQGNLLLPRTITERVWRSNDNAADMWSHFVNASYLVGDAALEVKVRGTMRDALRLTTRVGRLSEYYNIDTNTFVDNNPNLPIMIFGAAEEVKDGMVPIIDLTGQQAYVERARNLLYDIMANARVSTSRGKIPDGTAEVCGDMLQGLCRIYGATGDPNLKRWAEQIGDAWILDVLPRNNGLPSHEWNFDKGRAAEDMLQLNDHGNEIVVGLVELLYLERIHDTNRYNTYRPGVQKMIDQLLAHAIVSSGNWASQIQPSNLKVLKIGRVDTWGYVLNAVYSMYLLTGQQKYRTATETMMRAIAKDPQALDWGDSMDSYADSIESGIILYNRLPLAETGAWLEQVTAKFLAFQQANGLVRDTYLDGNYVRTALMWALMKTAGTRVQPWRADLNFGAAIDSGKLYLQLSAAKAWQGLLCLDGPRARQNLGLAVDYPRLNQFPQWFTIQPDALYTVTIDGARMDSVLGQDLIDGLALDVGTKPVQVVVWPRSGPPYAKQ